MRFKQPLDGEMYELYFCIYGITLGPLRYTRSLMKTPRSSKRNYMATIKYVYNMRTGSRDSIIVWLRTANLCYGSDFACGVIVPDAVVPVSQCLSHYLEFCRE